MAGSRGNKRKRPRRLEKDTTLCLSDLPDEILIRILSLLPTESAAATSLLSRRWRYLWISTPNIQLHESLFKNGRPSSEERLSLTMKRWKQFMSFAERSLLLRCGSASLVSFSFHVSKTSSEKDPDDESRFNNLITSAIRYNVEQLDLRGSFRLPFCLFECQSLVKLVLYRCHINVPPSMISLPLLKHLALEVIYFSDTESAEKLLSHPLLEELILCNCEWDYVKTTINVNSPKLQSLAIEDHLYMWSADERQVCFFGDKLKFFSYEGRFPPDQYCIRGSAMQLREVKILVVRDFSHSNPGNGYCNLINSLSMVQNLTLSNETLKTLYRLSQCPLLQTTLPVFERVSRLNLKFQTTISVDSKWLKMLYKRCPHLEHLNFMKMIRLDYWWKGTPILRPMPSCFRTHLKKVTIQEYQPKSDDEDSDDEDSDDEDPIDLLFNSAPVLEEVVIHWNREGRISDQYSKAAELEHELNIRPKVSENCRVSVILV